MKVWEDMLQCIHREQKENAMFLLVLGIGTNPIDVWSHIVYKLMYFPEPTKLYVIAMDETVFPNYQPLRTLSKEDIAKHHWTETLRLFNKHTLFGLEEHSFQANTIQNSDRFALGVIDENLPTNYHTNASYRKTVQQRRNISFLNGYENTTNGTQIPPCKPKEDYPLKPSYLPIFQGLLERGGNILLLNDAWWYTNGAVYTNVYFDRMCELIYFFRTVSKPLQIFLIYPDTSFPRLLFPIADLTTNFATNPTEYMYQVTDWMPIRNPVPHSVQSAPFSSLLQTVGNDGGHYAVNDFLEYIHVPDTMEPFYAREFPLAIAGLKEQETLTVLKYYRPDTNQSFYMVLYATKNEDLQTNTFWDSFHFQMSLWLDTQKEKHTTNMTRLESVSNMCKDLYDRQYHTCSLKSIQRIGAQRAVSRRTRKTRREPKGKHRSPK